MATVKSAAAAASASHAYRRAGDGVEGRGGHQLHFSRCAGGRVVVRRVVAAERATVGAVWVSAVCVRSDVYCAPHVYIYVYTRKRDYVGVRTPTGPETDLRLL